MDGSFRPEWVITITAVLLSVPSHPPHQFRLSFFLLLLFYFFLFSIPYYFFFLRWFPPRRVRISAIYWFSRELFPDSSGIDCCVVENPTRLKWIPEFHPPPPIVIVPCGCFFFFFFFFFFFPGFVDVAVVVAVISFYGRFIPILPRFSRWLLLSLICRFDIRTTGTSPPHPPSIQFHFYPPLHQMMILVIMTDVFFLLNIIKMRMDSALPLGLSGMAIFA